MKKIIDGKVVDLTPEEEAFYAEIAEEEKSNAYVTLVVSLIREKYTLDEELAIQRQRDTKTAEFEEYFEYCEDCKRRARTEIYPDESEVQTDAD